MPERPMADDGVVEDEVPIFVLGTTLLRNWLRIGAWAFVGAIVGILSAMTRPPMYSATATFVPQGAEASRSGLAGLAGQFGVALPAGNLSESPEFYSELLKSRELLLGIVRSSLTVDDSTQPVPFPTIFGITKGSAHEREQAGVKLLTGLISTSVSTNTAVVEVTVSTRWPAVSLGIVRALLAGLNDFNRRTRQSQASAERKFAEGRAVVVGDDLRVAEDRLEAFLQTNKVLTAPALVMQRDRLQRAVDLRQQLLTSLTQSMEEARLREVRDMPVVTVIDAPSAPVSADPRGRLKRGLLGILLGGMLGVLLAFAREAVARRRHAGDAAAEEFFATLRDVKGQLLGGWRRRGRTPTS